ncbi:MBL fold metallo-hydrolase [Prauserella halophila]|uniref:MBL fold metallo-hydrolase n=2 Tax=Prauserella halophila TaxID=185641 RepID=A0ABN1WJL3_9PSEU|nr:Ribonuclease BN, tRNA processing enzyme [Prauserella halophila]
MAKVHVLGSGTPTPTPDRFGSSYVIDLGGELVMVDCGPATTHKLAKAGLSATDVSSVFLTHHHFDHNVDLPCYLLVRWDQSTPDTSELEVFGPQPTSAIVAELIGTEGVFRRDIHARIEHPASQRVYTTRGGELPRPWPTWSAQDLVPGDVAERENWTVTTARASHVQPYLDSLAYRFDTPTGSVVITGDTARCAEVTELARGANTLLCCCWDHPDGDEQVDECVAEGMVGNMCGPADAAKIAAEAGVEQLVLVHATPSMARPNSSEKAVRIAEEIFDGTVVFAQEGLAVDI